MQAAPLFHRMRPVLSLSTSSPFLSSERSNGAEHFTVGMANVVVAPVARFVMVTWPLDCRARLYASKGEASAACSPGRLEATVRAVAEPSS